MIELDSVSKWFPTRAGRRYVFRNVDLRILPGQHTALLGRNGAGKSTLLRLIGGVDRPSSGTIRTTGSTSWPVGIAGSFQGSLSARENTRFVCRIYGIFDKDEISEKINRVRKFAEIGQYFDEPVNSYSSGMRARVGFGVSIAFDFDYFLLDEVTAVGDPAFKKKCNEELDRRRETSTFIICSHNVAMVQRNCQQAILVNNGQVVLYDDVEEAVGVYEIL